MEMISSAEVQYMARMKKFIIEEYPYLLYINLITHMSILELSRTLPELS